LLDTPMGAVYPLVPLFRDQVLGIALFSSEGRLHWGFNADWDAVPDLRGLVEGVAKEFDALRDAAQAAPVLARSSQAPTRARSSRRVPSARRRANASRAS
jgi:hypothetical protein